MSRKVHNREMTVNNRKPKTFDLWPVKCSWLSDMIFDFIKNMNSNLFMLHVQKHLVSCNEFLPGKYCSIQTKTNLRVFLLKTAHVQYFQDF